MALWSAPRIAPGHNFIVGNADPGFAVIARAPRPTLALSQHARALAPDAKRLGHLVVSQPAHIHGDQSSDRSADHSQDYSGDRSGEGAAQMVKGTLSGGTGMSASSRALCWPSLSC